MRAVIALIALLSSLLLFLCLLWLTADGSPSTRSWEKETKAATDVTPKGLRKLRSPLTSVQLGTQTNNRTTHKNAVYQLEQASKCKEMQDNILSSSIKKKRYSEDYYLQIVTKIKNCTWKRRPEECIKFRSELASCCDAVHNFIAYQNNTPLGSNMSYEVDNKKTILITEDIFRMLPEVSKTMDFSKTTRNDHVYQQIAKKLAVLQIFQTGDQGRERIKRLKNEYWKTNKNHTSGNSPTSWLFDRVVGTAPSVEPTVHHNWVSWDCALLAPESSMKTVGSQQQALSEVHEVTVYETKSRSWIRFNIKFKVHTQKSYLIPPLLPKEQPTAKPTANPVETEAAPEPGYPFKHCAVVGNGGILKNSSCGAEIDNSDFVFRCNLPPTTGSISKDVGKKTNLVTVNPSIIAQKYNKLNERKVTFLENIASYGNAFLLLPAFSFKSNTAASFKVYHTLQEFSAKQRAIFFHPRYLKSLAQFWRTKGVKAYRLSSGFMIASAAVELCENVKLYGFWPFSKTTEEMPISHHYYDNQLPKPGFHAMPKEYNQILQLHGKGILKLQFGTCDSD